MTVSTFFCHNVQCVFHVEMIPMRGWLNYVDPPSPISVSSRGDPTTKATYNHKRIGHHEMEISIQPPSYRVFFCDNCYDKIISGNFL